MKLRHLIRLLEEDGWMLMGQRGSDRQYAHPELPGTITVAGKPDLDVPTGTALAILRPARRATA